MNRKIVVPGEILVEGDDFLPGDFTEKIDGKIYAQRYGLLDNQNNLVKIIPLSGPYDPRRGNTVIGRVKGTTGSGWLVDIGYAEHAFLSVAEVPRYVNKDALEEVFAIGEMMAAKIWSIGGRGIDLSLKSRGFGKIHEGLVFRVNPNKVARIIGKEGSMVNLIKENTNSNITVAQNGFVWVKSEDIENEIFAKKAVMFVVKNSYKSGLTDLVTKWFEENKK